MSLMMMTLVACSGGSWSAQIWGEDYVEQGIPEAVFADGCSVSFTSFQVSLTQAELLDGDGSVVASLAPKIFELVEPGPQEVGEDPAPVGSYDTTRFALAPQDGAPTLHAAGTLSCGEESASFDWRFEEQATYLCEPENLSVVAGEVATTELTVHGDHLFYDGLEDPEAQVRGQALLDADADADGEITLEELGAVPIAPLGYSVGQQSDVEDLKAFVGALTRSVGHVDGEGHCQMEG